MTFGNKLKTFGRIKEMKQEDHNNIEGYNITSREKESLAK